MTIVTLESCADANGQTAALSWRVPCAPVMRVRRSSVQAKGGSLLFRTSAPSVDI